nr:MAG TPA: hypothetical protein [Caudoviricetes sp.]
MKEKTIKLEVGQEFKSYGDMMGYFGWKKKGGDSKKAQMKMIESYLDLEKVGRYGLKITEIKEQIPTREPEKEKTGRKSDYLDYMKPIILNTLANGKRGDHCIVCTKKDFFRTMALVNDSYSKGKLNTDKIAKIQNFPSDVVEYFFNSTYDNARSSIETVLNNLKKGCYIDWRVDWIIKKKGESFEKEAVGKDKEDIIQAQRDTLDELGLGKKATLRDIFLNGLTDEYYKKMGSKCEAKGMEYGYIGYIIITTKQFEEMALEVKEEKDLLNKINNIAYEKTLATGKRKQEQIKKEYKDLQEKITSSKIMGRPKKEDTEKAKELELIVLSDAYNGFGKVYADTYIKLPTEN